MDTDVVEQSGTHASHGGDEQATGETLAGNVETTIDEVDHLLDEVEAALTRLDEGTYGSCGICGTAIDDTSLATDPTVRHCSACHGDNPVQASDGDAGGGLADVHHDDGDERTNDAPAAPWVEQVNPGF